MSRSSAASTPPALGHRRRPMLLYIIIILLAQCLHIVPKTSSFVGSRSGLILPTPLRSPTFLSHDNLRQRIYRGVWRGRLLFRPNQVGGELVIRNCLHFLCKKVVKILIQSLKKLQENKQVKTTR
ncbi:hypothetical protein QL285_003117 [Trifolium repens]|nr:hypothetical protein QL285_003117 [Trifolium repens]